MNRLVRQAQERLHAVSPRALLIDQLSENDAFRDRDSPHKLIASAFGGIESAWVDVSATHSIDWKFVTIELGDNEHEIVYDDIRKVSRVGLSNSEFTRLGGLAGVILGLQCRPLQPSRIRDTSKRPPAAIFGLSLRRHLVQDRGKAPFLY